MDEQGILRSHIASKLTNCLQKRKTLDISDRPTDFSDHDVYIVGQIENPLFYLVGDMRDDLNRPAQIITPSFLGNHSVIDLSRCKVISLPHYGMGIAFVMPEIEVGFSPVIRDKNLTVLERIHRSRINIDVGIEFEHVDSQAPAFHKSGDRCRGKTFPQR